MTDLNQIRERLKAATPGPWKSGMWQTKTCKVFRPNGNMVADCCVQEDGIVCQTKLNAEFIAHAPTDMVALLADNDRLRGELRHVDAVLARRPALAKIPNRVDKILRALSVAGKAEP